MNELSVFHYEAADVRVVTDGVGEPWFVAVDVAAILGISRAQTIVERLDEDEHGKTVIIDALGREQETSIISESGLYEAIARSNKLEAKAFQRWVRKEVLPSIRKTGSYSAALPRTFSEALRLLADETEKRELVEKQLAIAGPKVEFFDAVAGSEDAIEIGRLAKVLNVGIGRNRLFEFMRDKRLLMHNNVPYQSTVDAGYFRVIEQKYNKPDGSVNLTTKTLARPKGQDYIRKLLIGSGYASKTRTLPATT